MRTEDDIRLLLKEICARMPYGVKVHVKGEYNKAHKVECVDAESRLVCWFSCMRYVQVDIHNVTLYLRPLSTMTDAEREEYKHLLNKYLPANPQSAQNLHEWLNAHHFDYNDLIEKGLAREAVEGMYDIK